jgi:hypothetical protein
MVIIIEQHSSKAIKATKSTRKPMKVLDHFIADLYWTSATGIFEEVFKETTAEMSDKQLKEYHLEKLDIMAKCKCDGSDTHTSSFNGILMDTSLFFYEITPELQKWIDENIVSFFNERGLKKLAITIAPGIFEQVAVEDASAECSNKYEVKFFPETSAAKRWLLQ